MGAWSAYFLAALGLHALGWITLSPACNLALAAAVLALAGWRSGTLIDGDGVPPPARPASGWRVLLVSAAAGLLWTEAEPVRTSAPALIGSLLDSAPLGWRYVGAQVLRLAQFPQVWQPLLALVGAVGLTLGLWVGPGARLRLRVRWSTLALVGLMVALVLQWAAPTEPATAGADLPPDAALARFDSAQRGLVLHLPELDSGPAAATDTRPAFDLVVLSLAGFGWDELNRSGLADAAFLRRLDVVFERYNSVASDGASALRRLQRGLCGQLPQRELREPVPADCDLMRALGRAGYQGTWVTNRAVSLPWDAALTPLLTSDGPAPLTGFDGRPVHADGETLTRVWRQRTAADPGAAQALIYLGATLHAADRKTDPREVGSPAGDRLGNWAARARRLLAELDAFASEVEASGRPTLLVLLPQHGAALDGEVDDIGVRLRGPFPGGIAGLHPWPNVLQTHVPAGLIALNLGPTRAAGVAPVHVAAVSNPLSVLTLVAAWMQPARGASDGAGSQADVIEGVKVGLGSGADAAAGGITPARLAAWAAALPALDWVAENDRALLLRLGAGPLNGAEERQDLRLADGRWIRLKRPAPAPVAHGLGASAPAGPVPN